MGGSDFRPGFDDRREVWRLLGHLDGPTRVAFLRECCRTVSTDGVKTDVTETDGSVNAVYWDLSMLCFDRGLSLADVGERLVRWVRRFAGGWRPAPRVPVSSGLARIG